MVHGPRRHLRAHGEVCTLVSRPVQRIPSPPRSPTGARLIESGHQASNQRSHHCGHPDQRGEQDTAREHAKQVVGRTHPRRKEQRCSSALWASTSSPSRDMVPESGCCSLAMVRISVDLPAPLGPNTSEHTLRDIETHTIQRVHVPEIGLTQIRYCQPCHPLLWLAVSLRTSNPRTPRVRFISVALDPD